MTNIQSILDGNRRVIARLLTEVENNTRSGQEALDLLYPHTGDAHLVGITGAPGTGKSSLVTQIILQIRQNNRKLISEEGSILPRIAVVAVDPSSPFTGGAILGDRIRMTELAGDKGVFIRSMATRGSLGGLASATAGAAIVLDAAGYDIVIIETVGAGQAEVDIAKLAHTTIVVESPGLGDDIQAIKAGILEIADILVINKADLPGVEITERALKGMLQLAYPGGSNVVSHHGQLMYLHNEMVNSDKKDISEPEEEPEIEPEIGWIPPVLRTIATSGDGVPDLVDLINEHRVYLQKSGKWTQRDRLRIESDVVTLLKNTLVSNWKESVNERDYNEILEIVYKRELSPSKAVDILIEKSLNNQQKI
jgi:LAO/AO transport system kinase